jgi:integrase
MLSAEARLASRSALPLLKSEDFQPSKVGQAVAQPTIRAGRSTIWHQSGVPARELAERAGHAKPSMSLDVYSHVLPPDEASSNRLQRLLALGP